jgi:hypothetical protein
LNEENALAMIHTHPDSLSNILTWTNVAKQLLSIQDGSKLVLTNSMRLQRNVNFSTELVTGQHAPMTRLFPSVTSLIRSVTVIELFKLLDVEKACTASQMVNGFPIQRKDNVLMVTMLEMAPTALTD